MTRSLIAPYGGSLVNLVVPEEERQPLARQSRSLTAVRLTQRALLDLELMAVGAFSPLSRFMGRHDYESVLTDMRLASGLIFPIPVLLPVPDRNTVRPGEKIVLVNAGNEPVAVMDVEELFRRDPEREAQRVCGTTDTMHPLVAEMTGWGAFAISGPVRLFAPTVYYDFRSLRLTPQETRTRLMAMGNPDVVAFQTRNPMHRVHEEMTKQAQARTGATLLLHPAVGMTKPGDVESHTRIKSYEALYTRYFNRKKTLLGLIPLAMRMSGPREAVWHAIIRRNYGANHFIVGRDHAGPGKNSDGQPFYPPYAAQDLFRTVEKEIGVTMVPFGEMMYLPSLGRYKESSLLKKNEQAIAVSGTQIRTAFRSGSAGVPEWMSRKEVADILNDGQRGNRGFCIWLTGLPASGKTTVATVLAEALESMGRTVTVLDGDVVRTHLSKGLGFSKEDRNTNVKRVGYVASEIVRHRGIAVCALVSPYHESRDWVRMIIGDERFILVHVATPLSVCMKRDPKGLYGRAGNGTINLTGLNDPYEIPARPDLTISTETAPASSAVKKILRLLAKRDLLPGKTAP